LRGAGFAFVHLGPRVLRVETAVTAGVALIKGKRGLM
jgi:16S rRNA U1498 N3-methylase RsmE